MGIKWHDPDCDNMTIHNKKGVTYLTYPRLDEFESFVHCFSTRLGGVSEGIFHSMNLSFTRGDREEDVQENYRRLADAAGFSVEDIVTSDQTHTTNIELVTEADRGCGVMSPRKYKDVDGMVTNVPGVILATFYADCVPLYFIDPVNKAVGLSHSGWRGTVGRMGAVTAERMQKEFGTEPSALYAAIGPSICQDCYEVSEDVILEFQKSFAEKHWDDLYYSKPDGKYQLNLWKANKIILMEAGVPEDHISMPNLCTCCNPDFLFSHRASKGRRGNLGAFLGIRPTNMKE